MTFQEKLHELTHRLLIGTSEGTIKWAETAEEDAFRAVLSSGLIRVEKLLSPAKAVWMPGQSDPGLLADNHDYFVVILDEKNKEIARYTPDTDERKRTLRTLWELAARSARRADEKIDFLLEEVGGRVRQKS